jgi:predicted SprT family Zn-dependent metalloprotease
MRLDEAWKIIRDVCEKCGCPEIEDEIRLEWSNRLTSSMGVSIKKAPVKGFTIRLSVKLFSRASHEEQINTVAHEACHVIDGIVNGWRAPHGETWEGFMRQAGYSSERCHTVSNAGLVKRFVYECVTCCKEFELSTRMHNSIVRGSVRYCRKCDLPIVYTGRVLGLETF